MVSKQFVQIFKDEKTCYEGAMASIIIRIILFLRMREKVSRIDFHMRNETFELVCVPR